MPDLLIFAIRLTPGTVSIISAGRAVHVSRRLQLPRLCPESLSWALRVHLIQRQPRPRQDSCLRLNADAAVYPGSQAIIRSQKTSLIPQSKTPIMTGARTPVKSRPEQRDFWRQEKQRGADVVWTTYMPNISPIVLILRRSG